MIPIWHGVLGMVIIGFILGPIAAFMVKVLNIPLVVSLLVSIGIVLWLVISYVRRF